MTMAECRYGVSGEALSKTIVDSIRDVNPDMNLCRGQGYDGAGAMAGVCSGASTRILEKFPKAKYVHCRSHMLNLCIAAACKLQMVNPVSSQVLEEVISKVCPDAQHKVILNVCRTKWIGRLDALDSFVDLFSAVFLTLEKITLNEDRKYSRKNVDTARPLYYIMQQFEFIVVLVIVQKTLGYTRGLTVKLQSSTTDLIQASEEVSLLHQTLKFIRSHMDTYFDQWYGKALKWANEIEVAEKIKRRCSIQIYRMVPRSTINELSPYRS
ncbi:52 kDa repressor of the inhibitor of the protein kinase-like [Hydractinia symbiolongicarpus]|uniref:52 kDa repressor of the inhibitor of the protein kinase-like n=1 Tax=Hydractinia symbiolongicarpus TaxID=13093 RepID=UPI00254A08B5|nr:52 kDa repressor of the inhibitor of the protein kinase-like [Hydractinia symbiolongicarpus]